MAWESNKIEPHAKQLQMLSDLLSFDSGIDLPKPNKRCLLGFAQYPKA
jgi:hypothetical protein